MSDAGKPTAPGWYWYKDKGFGQFVWVTRLGESGNGSLVQFVVGASECRVLSGLSGEWRGPITPPEDDQ